MMPSDPLEAFKAGETADPRPDPPTQPAAPPESSPPGAPVATPPPLPGQPKVIHGRLHPLTLLFRAIQTIRSIIIPAVIFIAMGNDRTVGILMLILVVIPMTLAVVRYFTFTYRIEAGELITRQGLLGRTERHIPLARVQDIRVEQGMLHRLFKMADVQVETAGSQGPEASLSVLSMAEADRLRSVLFDSLGSKDSDENNTANIPELVRALSVKELIIAGLTSNKLASVLAVMLLTERIGHNLLPRERYEQLIGNFVARVQTWAESLSAPGGFEAAWLVVALGIAALTLIGIAVSVVGSIVNFYGFSLSRVGEDLHRKYGLLTRRSSSLPRGRIQVLQVEEKLLRRLFRLATLRADTAGSKMPNSRSNNAGRDLLLPIIARDEVEGLLPVFFPDWDPGEADWQRVSKRAIYRGTIKGTLLCMIVAAVFVLRRPELLSLWPLVFVPFIYLLNLVSYNHLGYGLSRHYFRTRRGWLSRATHVVPIRNTQSIVLRQNPFDRRHKVSTLSVDTAGQAYTGGGPQIDNVPEEQAIALARALAHRAAETRYHWASGR